MSNSNILRAFINHFDELIEDVIRVCPDNNQILKCKMYFEAIKKTNPKLLIQNWKILVSDLYRTKIEAGDVTFFMTKDYSADTSASISKTIDDLRSTIFLLSPENKSMAMKYVQNITKLCDVYYTKN